MPSPLEQNKRAQRTLQQLISEHAGLIRFSGYGRDSDLVGAFVPSVFVSVAGTLPFSAEIFHMITHEIIPIQSCPLRWLNGALAGGNNYRLAEYKVRWAVQIEERFAQLQELRDDPEDSTRELWVCVLELR